MIDGTYRTVGIPTIPRVEILEEFLPTCRVMTDGTYGTVGFLLEVALPATASEQRPSVMTLRAVPTLSPGRVHVVCVFYTSTCVLCLSKYTRFRLCG